MHRSFPLKAVPIALFVIVLILLSSSARDSNPVQVTFLGYTNYNDRTLALFGITNHQNRDLRGFAYVQKWAGSNWPTKSVWPQTHLVQVQTPTGPAISNYQVWSFSGETAPREEQRQIWLGSRQNPPNNGMTLGIPQPFTTNSWKLALYFPVYIGNWTNPPTLRDRLVDFCLTKGHTRLAHRIKPVAAQPLFQYGPEMK